MSLWTLTSGATWLSPLYFQNQLTIPTQRNKASIGIQRRASALPCIWDSRQEPVPHMLRVDIPFQL